MSTPTSRSFALVPVLFFAFAASASAQLTKAQQGCVNTQNAQWLKIGSVLAKTTASCLKDFHKGSGVDIEPCFGASADGLIAASDKSVDAYDKSCVGLDGDGVPKFPLVFATDPETFVHASLIEWGRSLRAAHGTDHQNELVTDASDSTASHCQSGVEKTLTKCAAVFRKAFNACKKSALAGKKPFVAPITTPAELAACIGSDPKSAIAKACNDKVAQTLGKQCVDKGADLGVAFAHCGSTDPAAVQACVASPLRRAVCKSIVGTDALPDVCDVVDDGAANGSAAPIEVLVPAYGNPCCADGPAMWAGLLAAATAGQVQLNVILNPASGPGAGPTIDPNYVNDDPAGPLLDVRAAGAKIYGYVSTSFATRDLQDAKDDIDLYYTASYWRGAGVQVDGIFLDEMSSDLPDVGYYQQLRDYVHAKSASARVIANPGQPATQDSSGGASGFTVMDYATAADVLVTFEGTGTDYLFLYQSPAWVDALPASHFAHLVHSQTDAADMSTDLDFARLRNVGMIYVTGDVLSPNPWDSLATYWLDELDSLHRLP
jgi:hypothetical protein